jgi:energy-coupling factor transporter ATP-binding protein EcfA2
MRPGELTTLMGYTGVGKSTLSTAIAWNIANQGIKTMIGSFELPFHSYIIPKILSFACGKNIQEPKIPADEFKALIQGLSDWGYIYPLNRVGSTSISEIRASIDVFYNQYGGRFVVLDHLHYFIQPGDGERSKIEEAMIELQKMVKEDYPELSILLVVHPAKPKVDFKTGMPHRLTIHDARGSARIPQDSDNFWLLNFNYDTAETEIEIGKLRSEKCNVKSGGVCRILFDKMTYNYKFI